jgi:hypothetical protein
LTAAGLLFPSPKAKLEFGDWVLNFIGWKWKKENGGFRRRKYGGSVAEDIFQH